MRVEDRTGSGPFVVVNPGRPIVFGVSVSTTIRVNTCKILCPINSSVTFVTFCKLMCEA